MKQFKSLVRLSALLFAVVAMSTQIFAQGSRPAASPHAAVTQRLDVDTDITFDFSRPGVKGRAIWGELVPYGLAEGNQYSDNKPYPWRAGANQNTTIECSKDILINGNKLPAGKYSIHMIPSEKDWEVIFNKANDGWGSYKYDQSQDVFRIKVTPEKASHQEYLTYGFDIMDPSSATAFLHWEKLKVPFKIEAGK